MNLTHSSNDAVSIDPRWLIDQSDHGVDGRGFWARPFADETSLLRIDFFDPAQVPAFFDGMCRLSARDRNGARRLQRVAPAMRLFGPGGHIDRECFATPAALEFILPFTASVPQPLRRLVGRFDTARSQWAVLDIFQEHLELGEMLPDHEAWVAEVLRLWLRFDNGFSREDIVKQIRGRKRHELVQGFVHHRVEPRHIRALSRLAPDLKSDSHDDYWSIARSDVRFRALQHVDVITSDLVRYVLAMPTWVEVLNPRIFKFVDARAAEHLASLLVFDGDMKVPSGMEARVRSAQSRKAVMAIRVDVRFPPSPVAGDDHLEPITDFEALKRAGRDLRNCAADLVADVVDGHSYFLRWKGRRPGLVEIERDEKGDWAFSGALGIGNSRLHRSTIKAIKRRLEAMSTEDRL